jgi:uncharacterized protein (TIGR00645 family)
MWLPIGRGIQSAVFFSRWLVAPFLLGMACCLLLILYRFFADLFQLAVKVPTLGWHDLLVDVLNLIDLTLTANLVLIVIFSGYESYIRKIVPGDHSDWPEGLVDLDFSVLKQKLLGSIAGIAAVDALAWYLDLDKSTDTSKLGWAIAFPLMFVTAMVPRARRAVAALQVQKSIGRGDGARAMRFAAGESGIISQPEPARRRRRATPCAPHRPRRGAGRTCTKSRCS